MKFRTEIPSAFVADLVSYQSKILTIGSCFADNMGEQLAHYGFDVTANPFGVIFNPVSILKLLKNSFSGQIDGAGFLQRDQHFLHYDFHSEVCADSQDGLADEIVTRQQNAREVVVSGNVLIITFGTAWVYRHLRSNEIVANCHKVPQVEFQKELLEVESLKKDWTGFLSQITEQNKNLQIILTVSPVRHIKDGLHENNVSKSILLLLADHLEKNFKQVHYFPAYEIILDDLRDYRFFKEDLIHPTEQAIRYVFDTFSDFYFSEKTKKAVELKKQILKMEGHRFLNASKDQQKQHQQVIEKLRNEFERLR